MLTDIEEKALIAILDEAIEQTGDDVDPVYEEVPLESVKPFGDPLVQSKVYDSLAAKGLIQCSGDEDDHGRAVFEFVCITPEGWDALKATKGLQ